jgi:O-antigen/teichoic acid export membrane protein
MIYGLLQRVRNSPTGLTALTGYAAMISTLIAGVFSVPLALRCLSNEEFGLWNLVGQSLGYLLLLDFGVSWSASRMLIGPLRSGDSDELNSWWTVIVMVLAVQGLAIGAIGLGAKGLVIGFFHLSAELLPDAELLWIGMILINAIQMPFKAYTAILYCQDRWYVWHLISIFTSWLNLAVFAALLFSGFRTSAYLVATALSIGSCCALCILMVRKSGIRLRISWKLFDSGKMASLFRFSSGLFLLAMATQLTVMTQSIIVAKVVGVGAVAAFVVSTKSFTVVQQLVKRAYESFSPRWTHLYVSGEKEAVLHEWRTVMSWLLPAGLIGAIGILVFNRSFSMLYGGASNHVSRDFDFLLAAGLVVQMFVNFTGFVFPLSARIKGWCIAGLVDAVLQLGLGVIFTKWLGSCGVLIGALLGPVLVTVPFLVFRAPAELGISKRAMFTGVLKMYGAAFLALLACYLLLGKRHPHEWWPTGMEYLLGVALMVLSLIWINRFRNIFGGAKQVEA